MQLGARKLLQDPSDAARALESFSADRSFDEYLVDALARRAIEREFEILGEALRQLAVEDEVVFARIPRAREFIAFRNVLAHRYADIDPAVACGTIHGTLPELATVLRALQPESA